MAGSPHNPSCHGTVLVDTGDFPLHHCISGPLVEISLWALEKMAIHRSGRIAWFPSTQNFQSVGSSHKKDAKHEIH
jgi:hypothetical protein